MRTLRVLSVVSEIYPLVKTGGLADVAGALPIALQAEGIETRTLVPGYPAVLDALEGSTALLARRRFSVARSVSLAGHAVQLTSLYSMRLISSVGPEIHTSRPTAPTGQTMGFDSLRSREWPRILALAQFHPSCRMSSIATIGRLHSPLLFCTTALRLGPKP